MQSMLASNRALFECVKAFSETDFNDDLAKLDVPTLVIHGDDDQIVPYNDSAMLTVKRVKNAKLETYKGAPHGLIATMKDRVSSDLLAFAKSLA